MKHLLAYIISLIVRRVAQKSIDERIIAWLVLSAARVVIRPAFVYRIMTTVIKPSVRVHVKYSKTNAEMK